MKISVICTLKNEKATVESLIGSLFSQTREPDEVVIVDGGSKDGTLDIINSHIKKNAPIKLIIQERANIAKGRNIAIRNARYDYIACIDAGSRPDKDWMKNLIEPFENDINVDVVFGFFLPEVKNIYEQSVGELLYPKLEIIDTNKFLPRGGAIAFKKECWRKIGGYPEWLNIGEDAFFDLKLKDAGYKFAFAKDSIVYWRPRENLWGLFKQYYLYAKGAAQGNFTSSFLFEAYGGNAGLVTIYNMKNLLITKKLMQLCLCFVILPTVFFAKILGTIAGKINSSGEMAPMKLTCSPEP